MKVLFVPRMLTVQLALAIAFGCSSIASPARPSQSGSVRIVEQGEFDAMRDSGQWVFELRGDVAAAEACASGSVDDECVAAVRERLRAAAIERGANLVLMHPASTLQSYPPRYAVTGVLYDIRPR
jgi:hypothetical protein